MAPLAAGEDAHGASASAGLVTAGAEGSRSASSVTCASSIHQQARCAQHFSDGPRLAGIAGTAMLLVGDVRVARSLIGEALRLAVTAIAMNGANILMPVVTRAAAVHATVQPWAGIRAVAELDGQVAAVRNGARF
jgi:hypothetical protein